MNKRYVKQVPATIYFIQGPSQGLVYLGLSDLANAPDTVRVIKNANWVRSHEYKLIHMSYETAAITYVWMKAN